MIRLSIIVVNYNTCGLLKKCLDSINKNSINLIKEKEIEVIVVDNSSDSESCEYIKNNFPEIILIKNTKNYGFGKANNQGIKIAKGKYILLLNSDIEAMENSIEKLLYFIENSKKVSFAGGKLLNPNLTPQSSSGPFFSLWVIFLMLFLKGDKLEITRYSPDKISKVDWVSGACLIGKKEDFEKAGLFDENIFMYMDEIDFLYRANKINLQTYFFPDAKFIHVGSASSNDKKTPVINIYKGLIYFYGKYKTTSQSLLLKFMLKLKALISLIIGFLIGSSYLKKTYAEAFKLA